MPTDREPTVMDVLCRELTRQGMQPQPYDYLRVICVLVTARDNTAIVISDPYSDDLHAPLSRYEGLMASRFGHHVDPTDPAAALTPHEREVYFTPEPLRGAGPTRAQADITAAVRAIVTDAARPLEVPQMGDLVIAALANAELSGELVGLGGGTTAVYADLEDGTNVLITDPEGARITYPAQEHAGLLVCRYPHGDIERWNTVYDSRATDAGGDVRAAVAAIARAAQSPFRY